MPRRKKSIDSAMSTKEEEEEEDAAESYSMMRKSPVRRSARNSQDSAIAATTTPQTTPSKKKKKKKEPSTTPVMISKTRSSHQRKQRPSKDDDDSKNNEDDDHDDESNDMDVDQDQAEEEEKEEVEVVVVAAKRRTKTKTTPSKKEAGSAAAAAAEQEEDNNNKMDVEEDEESSPAEAAEEEMKDPTKGTTTPKQNSSRSSSSSSKSKKSRKSKGGGSCPAKDENKSDDKKALSGEKRKKTPPSNKNKKGNNNKPTTTTLDVHIHRLRHLQYHPAAVTAMAATSQNGYVAVARQDGSFQLKVCGVLEDFRDDKYLPHLVTVSEIPPPILEHPTALVANAMCWVETTTTGLVDEDQQQQQQPPSCVAASATGNIWIVDHERSQMVSAVHSNGGGVFDLVTCSSSTNAASGSFSLPMFAAACQDGSVRIWQVANGGSNENTTTNKTRSAIVDPPLVTVPSMGAPVLSVAWKLCGLRGIPKDKDEDNDGSSSSRSKTLIQTVLYAAVADGTIRKYSINLIQHCHGALELRKYQRETSSSSRQRHYEYTVDKVKSILRMTVESKGRRTATKVWSLCALDDGTLIAGNSLGQVQFWNSQTGTLQQTVLQTSLQADVLKVVANDKGTKVFCSGVDSRVVCIERPPAKHSSSSGGSTQWKLTHVQRPHSHDVKAMVLLPGEDYVPASKVPRRLETLISGGVDTKLCSYMVAAFGAKRPQPWLPWPMQSPISTSSNPSPPRLLSMQRRDRIELYELEKLPGEATAKKNKANPQTPQPPIVPQRQTVKKLPASTLLGSIQIDRDANDVSTRLLASQLSPTGRFLAVSTGRSVLAFYLNRTEPEEKDSGVDFELRPIKMKLPAIFQSINATALQFWGNVLYVGDATKRQIHVVHLKMSDADEGAEMKVSSFSLPEVDHAIKGEVRLPIQSIEVGRNGRMLVVSSHTRDSAVHVFTRESDDANYHHDWTLPKIGSHDSRPAASNIVMKSKLAVATYQSHVYLFNVKDQRLSSWSEKYGFPIKSEKWTEDLLCRKDFPLRLIENPNDRSQIIIASFGTFCIMSLQKTVPRYCRSVPDKHIRRRQYKTPEDNDTNPWIKPRVSKPVTDDEESGGVEMIQEAESPQNEEMEVEQVNKKQKMETHKQSSEVKPYQGSRNCTVCLQYNGMLYLDFVGQNEMVVVEQPWLEVVETLPEALQRRVYGLN